MRTPLSAGHPRVNFKSIDNLPQIKKKASVSFGGKQIFYHLQVIRAFGGEI